MEGVSLGSWSGSATNEVCGLWVDWSFAWLHISKTRGLGKVRWFSSALTTLRFEGSPVRGRHLLFFLQDLSMCGQVQLIPG